MFSISNLAGIHPVQGMVEPPTTQICLLQGIKSSDNIPNWVRCSVPARHIVAPLSGKMFIGRVTLLRAFVWPNVIFEEISPEEGFGLKLAKICSIPVSNSCVGWETSEIPRTGAFDFGSAGGCNLKHTEALWSGSPQWWQGFPQAGHLVSRSWEPCSELPHPLHVLLAS